MKQITITQKKYMKKYQKHEKCEKYQKHKKYRLGVKEAGKKPCYPNPNTPKTHTIQIVNPFYYY